MAKQTSYKRDKSYDTVDNDENDEKKPRGPIQIIGGWIQSFIGGIVNCAKYLKLSAYHRRPSDDAPLYCWLTCGNWLEYTIFLFGLWFLAGVFFYLMLLILQWEPVKGIWAFLIIFAAFVVLFGVLIATYKEPEEDENMACSIGALKRHIEGHQNFSGMSWDQLGTKWHIVHATPVYEDNPSSSGYEETLEQICQRLHYTNTMPVWSKQMHTLDVSEVKGAQPQGDGEEKETIVRVHN